MQKTATKNTLTIEFSVLFVLLPIFLAMPFWFYLKIVLVVFAVVYVVYQMKQLGLLQLHLKKVIGWSSLCKRIAVVFTAVAVLTIIYVHTVDADALFYVPRDSPGLFLIIVLFYTVFSVWPQELIYRTVFFERYASLFNNAKVGIVVNALVFSLAHLFFKNLLVLGLTFFGGLLFAYTYTRYKSTAAVTLEHAIYGNWIFAVGMGQMLAFPGMEN